MNEAGERSEPRPEGRVAERLTAADSEKQQVRRIVRRPQMSASLLEARGLHTYYGASHILHGVDFSIGAGETVGLMGRNGMGKSTLIRSMLGLVKPRAGEVRVRGTAMTGADTFRVARQGIAYVPEGRGIFPNLTVRENLVDGGACRVSTDAATGRTSARSRRFRASPSASITAARSSRAASSRC
jgi:ABC-type branched-subunit amino acid transport system ATPase component